MCQSKYVSASQDLLEEAPEEREYAVSYAYEECVAVPEAVDSALKVAITGRKPVRVEAGLGRMLVRVWAIEWTRPVSQLRGLSDRLLAGDKKLGKN